MEVSTPVIEVVREPGRCGGAPSLKGTRIGIHDIVSYARIYGGDLRRVSEDALPHLTLGQIEAAMAWYAEHRDEVDEALRRREEAYEESLARTNEKS